MSGSGDEHVWVIGDEAGDRIDLHISQHLELSRSRVVSLIADGQVWLDGRTPKKSEVTEPGQTVRVMVPPPVALDVVAQDIPVDIVYEDAHLVVVNKQPGLVVHPAPGHPDGTLVNALLHHTRDLAGIGGALRPGIVHRLDRDTSGLMVVAKSDVSHQGLSQALKDRKVKRTYTAALWGTLPQEPVVVEEPIGRHPRDRKRMAVVRNGRPAASRFRAIETWTSATLCEVDLRTGRTHQIRVHALHIGHPVVGDPTYGGGAERGFSGTGGAWAKELARRTPRQFLHASSLAFEHPVSGESMVFQSSLPDDLAAVREWALSD